MIDQANVLDQEIDRESSKTLFAQLEEILLEKIEDGIWQPGEPIPSERELSKIYKLSRMTVRKALDRLVAAGQLFRVDGKGTFVSEPKVSFQALTLAGLREQTIKLGFSPSAKLLGIERVLASEKVAAVLKIKPDSPVFLRNSSNAASHGLSVMPSAAAAVLARAANGGGLEGRG